ncbi:hypothetical protein BKP64_18150 [Marinobacter salinus]|uniref:Uncharacterized protein n=1 Tax=Marinobacter salinus TaxID=1874317 RepID=A0A1D9GQZ7_9GAMM|nr:hypothetical protein [Marinobacter salinus]AOY89931.1 hypothetical protein BKP64_18150 [Marinobacter salinus]
MANIPSKESVLAFIRDILQAGPADKKRREFEELRRKSDSQLATTEDYVDDILSSLGVDEVAQLQARHNFSVWSEVNNFLERNIWVSHSDPKHVIWLMATHVYAPGLGRHLAFWDTEQKTDPGMPGGRFWYLPAVMEENDEVLTMPVTQVLDWLLDLLSGSIDELAQALTDSNMIGGREKDTVADARSIRKTLGNWYTGARTPGINKILEFFPNRLNLKFKGTFEWDENNSLDENFERARAFVKLKGLNEHALSVETPIPEEMAKNLLENDQLSAEEKDYFCHHVSLRYHPPTIRTIRKRLLYARAFQATYFMLAEAIGVPDEAKRLPNPSINQAMQVVSLFQVAYNTTIGTCKRTDDERTERQLFRETLDERFPLEARTTLLSVTPLDGNLNFLSNQLNKRLMELGNTDPIQDESPFAFSKEHFVALYKRKAELLRACQIEYEESDWLNTAPTDSDLYQRIDNTQNWAALNSVVCSDTISLPVRRAAGWRMVNLASTDLEQAYGFVSLLSQLLNDPDKRNRPADARELADTLFNRLKQLPTADNLRPLILQLEAKHELANNHLEASKKKFDQALNMLSRQGFGDIRGEVARDALAVFACGHHRGFNPGACDQYRLSIIYYGGLEEPVMYLPSTEEMVKKVREYFWENLYQTYEGVPRLQPQGG